LTRATTPNAAVRSVAYEAMVDPFWPSLFEGCDSGVTRVPVEVCHPFFDLRLVDFLLALPALPWCSDKELLREAARGILPDAVRLRRKSPLLADPLIALVQQPESAWVDSFEGVPELGRYVERRLIPKVFGEKESVDGMDSSSASQSELLVAVAQAIRYKRRRRSALKERVQERPKKLYQRPKLRAYGDIRTMTMGNVSGTQSDNKIIGPTHFKTQ